MPRISLTEGERRFVAELAADPNAARAYRRAFPAAAGGSARTLAARLLAKVDIRVALRRARRGYERRCRVDGDRVNRELSHVAFLDPADCFLPDPNGGPLQVRPLHDIPAAARRAIQSIKVKKRTIKDGTDSDYVIEEVEYRFASKLDALDKLCKRLGLYDADPTKTDDPGSQVRTYVEIPDNGRDRESAVHRVALAAARLIAGQPRS